MPTRATSHFDFTVGNFLLEKHHTAAAMLLLPRSPRFNPDRRFFRNGILSMAYCLLEPDKVFDFRD